MPPCLCRACSAAPVALALLLLSGCAARAGTAAHDPDLAMNAAEAMEAEMAGIPRICVRLGRAPDQATVDRLDSFFNARAMGLTWTLPPPGRGEVEVCGLAATVADARAALRELQAELPPRARARLMMPRPTDRRGP